MIYIRAGVFAEGPTDYDFLLPLLDRLLDEHAASLFPAAYELGPTARIGVPSNSDGGRAERMAAAIERWWDACTLFVIHSDGAGDPLSAKQRCIEPGLKTAGSSRPERSIAAAACVPVRETEAWMLVDPAVFHMLLGASATLSCPSDPEHDPDQKATLQRILKDGGLRRPQRVYAYFGEHVRFETMRVLPAFKAFEDELVASLGQHAASA